MVWLAVGADGGVGRIAADDPMWCIVGTIWFIVFTGGGGTETFVGGNAGG